jgi:hypothetical protein
MISARHAGAVHVHLLDVRLELRPAGAAKLACDDELGLAELDELVRELAPGGRARWCF